MKTEYSTGILSGIAMWSHLDKPEVFNGTNTGKLSITVVPDVKEAERMEQEAREAWDQYYANEKSVAGKKLKGEPNLGMKEDKEGNVVFKFVTNEKIHTKDGKVLKKTIPIFDGCGNEVTKKISKMGIGNGSNIVVSYQLFPYFNSSNVYGVSLRLQGIQIIKYKKYAGVDADSLGFAKVKGSFDASSLIDDDDENDELSNDDIPFETDEDF